MQITQINKKITEEKLSDCVTYMVYMSKEEQTFLDKVHTVLYEKLSNDDIKKIDQIHEYHFADIGRFRC